MGAAAERATSAARSAGVLCLELLLSLAGSDDAGRIAAVTAATAGFTRGAAGKLLGGVVLCPQAGAPEREAVSLAALAAGLASQGVPVLGVHATVAREGLPNLSGEPAVAAAVAGALARAAAVAGVRHTLALALPCEPARPGPGGASAALGLAGVAMSSGCSRLVGCGRELAKHKGMLMALADARVMLQWDDADGAAEDGRAGSPAGSPPTAALAALLDAGCRVALLARRSTASFAALLPAQRQAARLDSAHGALLPPHQLAVLLALMEGQPAPSAPAPPPPARALPMLSPLHLRDPPAAQAAPASPQASPSRPSPPLRSVAPTSPLPYPSMAGSPARTPSADRSQLGRAPPSPPSPGMRQPLPEREGQEEEEEEGSVAAWLTWAVGGGCRGEARALAQRLQAQLRAATAAAMEQGGGADDSALSLSTSALLRAAAAELARLPETAELLRRATRADPGLPWSTAGSAMPGSRLPSPAPGAQPASWWSRVSGASPTNFDIFGRRSAPIVLEAACAACRAAMLSETFVAGRYLPDPAVPPKWGRGGDSVVLLAHDASAGFAPCALLILRSRERWLRERTVRSAVLRTAGAGACDAGLLRLLRAHDGLVGGRSAGMEWVEPEEESLAACCRVDPAGCATLAEECSARGLPGSHLLVLDRAACSLADMLSAQRLEAPPPPPPLQGRLAYMANVMRLRRTAPRTAWGAVRSLGWRLALGLHALHEAGMAHGAVCPGHVMLLPSGGEEEEEQVSLHRWALCDLSASVFLQGAESEFLSAASSRAGRCLPPEAVLPPSGPGDGHALKLQPRGASSAWAAGCLRAAVALDAWGLGAVLFEAAVGESLLDDGPADDDGGEASETHLQRLAQWDATSLAYALDRVMAAGSGGDADAAACLASLLRLLLSPVPAARPSSMRDVLAHRFLNPAAAAVPERAADIAAAALVPPARDGWAPPVGWAPGSGGGGVIVGVTSSRSKAGSPAGSDQGQRVLSASPANAPSPGPQLPPLPPRRSPSPGLRKA